jgi:transposase
MGSWFQKKPKQQGGCPNCQKLQRWLDEALARIADLEAKYADALRQIEELRSQLGRNSRNSSIPPSQDPPNAPVRPQKAATGRHPGGQEGHKGKKRDLVPLDKVQRILPVVPKECEHCGHDLAAEASPNDPPFLRYQTYELPDRLFDTTEYQLQGRRCQECGKVTYGSLPKEVVGHTFGPRLTALVIMLTGVLQSGRRGAVEFVRDVLGVPISLGTVSNLEGEMTEALEAAHEEAKQEVQEALAKNVDETGWKQGRAKRWLWTVATATVAFFHICVSRGKEGMMGVLGPTLKGIFTTDRWVTYFGIPVRLRQLCWAHLKRDFQRVQDMGGATAWIGTEGLRIAGELFGLWKDFRAGVISRRTLQKRLRPLKRELIHVLIGGVRLRAGKVSTFCGNLLDLDLALWTFAYHEGVEPTNNHAERVLRRGVLWRKRSFGAKSERGCRFAERMLTAVQTLRLQNRPVLDFLTHTLHNYRAGVATPSLVHA